MYLKELKAGSRRDVCTPMFAVALFTAAKTGKHPSVNQPMNGEAKRDPSQDGMSFILKQKGDSDTCHHMDEPGGHSAQWEKPVNKGQIL